MKVDCLIAEIGSTTTTVNVFDHLTSAPQFLGQGLALSTPKDVQIGLKAAMEDFNVRHHLSIEPNTIMASSSAAGGLKMSVHGLVYDMTVKAAKEAALGAGANIKMVTSGLLSEDNLNQIKQLNLNIIMIAGGVDYGESETALANAVKIAQLKLSIPVIYAGNCVNHHAVTQAFQSSNQQDYLIISENVYPKIDEINIEGVRSVIHRVFEKHIIHAPGMSDIHQMVNGVIIPTPGAVYEACRLLQQTIGELVCCDIGGATTDVVSIGASHNIDTNLSITPEPFAKRTVEGDLGVYINRMNLVNLIGRNELMRKLSISEETLLHILDTYQAIPTSQQMKLTKCLIDEALKVGMRRHAGVLRHYYQGSYQTNLIEGKDLRQIKNFIATGGALTQLPETKDMIQSYLDLQDRNSLKPSSKTSIWIDRDYILASCGVLAKVNPTASLALMLQSIGWEELRCTQE
ncbi:MAG: glutamate mutase L [Bacilli bacterium]